jgi:hypothetical protein
MKNHWLTLHEQKKRRFWTAEFSKNGIFVLKPRRVGMNDRLGFMGSVSGVSSITFKDAMTKTSDQELVDFLTESRKTMAGWLARLRLYASLMNELEYFELSDLTYDNVGIGETVEDLKLSFGYNQLKHVHCA